MMKRLELNKQLSIKYYNMLTVTQKFWAEFNHLFFFTYFHLQLGCYMPLIGTQ